MNIKGKLIIIGGGEDKGAKSDSEKNNDLEEFLKNGILARIVKESRQGKRSQIEIVPTASNIADKMGNDYLTAFKKLGATNCDILNITTREQAHNEQILKRLEKADVVFFSGGNQLRLTSILGGTPFYDLLIEKLQTDSKFIYAGSSAGAAAASESMIAEGNSKDAFLKGEVKTSTGFGVIENMVFDTHFIQRGRIGRLFQLIATNPKILGVGLEENSGLLITNNNKKMEAIGPGLSVLVDGTTIRNSNLLEIIEGAPISIDNLTLHLMSKTDVFDVVTRRLTLITSEEYKI